jgi:TonB-dependent receptor
MDNRLTPNAAMGRFLAAVVATVALVAGFAGAPRLQAQSPGSASGSAEGRLFGQVLDAATGQSLPGAQIVLEDGPRGVVAGVDGRFQLDRIPVGPVSLRIQLIGYAPRTVTGIEVSASGITRIDLLMERQAVAVAGITVSADVERGSAVSLLSEQRTSESVVNAISAEQIARSPDGDAAAAVKRVSGVTVQDGKYVFVRGLGERYTTSSLNGTRIPSPEPERKIVPLDLFPSGLLQAITTSKTFTPDQSGDFSGGNVDIRTPSFPTRTTWSLSASTGWDSEATGRTLFRAPTVGGEWAASATGPRSIPEAAATFSGASSRGEEVNRVVNSFRPAWSVQEASGRLPLSLGGSVGGSMGLFGQTLGYLGSLTYGTDESARVEETRARIGTGDVPIDVYEGSSGTSSVLWGGLANISMLVGTHSQLHLNNTYNRSADNTARQETGTDENTQARVQVDRLTYVERTVRSNQLKGEHQLGMRNAVEWSLSNSAVRRSEPDRSEFVTWLDPEVPVWFNDFEGAVRTFGELDETSSEATARYEFSFGSNRGNPNRIRVGGAWRTTERDTRSQGFRIQSFDWAPNDPRWQAPPEEFFDGRHAGNGDAIFLLSRELSGGSYDAADELVAGFAMAEFNVLERLRLIGGARVEQYTLTVNAENQLGQASVVERDYTDVLPSLTAIVGLGGDHQLRLAASRTLARPEYRELAPITYREVLGGEQVIGNSELERTLIQNYDARWEWYPAPGEVLSLGVFAKRFDQPVEERYLARSGTDTRTFQNSESATNEGVEVEAGLGLGRFSRALEPLSVFTNWTVMRSRVRTGVEEDVERPMVGQAPYVFNAGATWSAPLTAWSGTLLYNVVGERIVNARASGATVSDVVERPRHVVDFSIRMPLPGNASGKVDFRNLLDAPVEVRQGTIVRSSYRTGRSVSAGLSWRW